MKKIIYGLLIIMAWVQEAQACGMLQSADPKVGSTVAAGITQVSLEFSETVYPKKSSVHVLDSAGHDVSIGAPFGDAKDSARISTHVAPLARGKYKVRWDVYCECKSLMPGSYTFWVK